MLTIIKSKQEGSFEMIYVMSDIHGNLRRFNSIMKQIKLTENDTLYILGDVIDRYPEGIKILRKLMAMDNVKMILGNHEYMMLDSIYYTGIGMDSQKLHGNLGILRPWYENGGYVTHNYLKQKKIFALRFLNSWIHSP